MAGFLPQQSSDQDSQDSKDWQEKNKCAGADLFPVDPLNPVNPDPESRIKRIAQINADLVVEIAKNAYIHPRQSFYDLTALTNELPGL